MAVRGGGYAGKDEPQCSARVSVGQPAQLEASFAPACFSKAGEEPTQAIENRAEAPHISFRLLDADALHTLPSCSADRCV